MVDYNLATGTDGVMTIRDTGTTVEYWLYVPLDAYISEIPWAFTLNGRTEWRVFNRPRQDTTPEPGEPAPITNYQVHAMAVTYGQTVGFHLGDTNSTDIGGPTDFLVYLSRGGAGAGAHLTDGLAVRKAIPYVNVNGVWKLAEPWSKIAGEWKQTI